MPTYEYRCNACRCEFERDQSIRDDPIKICPECGQEAVERLISHCMFRLTGGGWADSGYSRVLNDPSKPSSGGSGGSGGSGNSGGGGSKVL